MRNCVLLIVLAAVGRASLGAEPNAVWVTDWRNLSEVAHGVRTLHLEGVVEGKEGHSYAVHIETRQVSSGDLQKNTNVKYYGLNRRGADALNTQITTLELVIGNSKMKVSERALADILNPLIGERMEMLFSDDQHHVTAVIIDGPVGAESYIVAFIFEDGKFRRRQIRAGEAGPNGWPLLEDKRY